MMNPETDHKLQSKKINVPDRVISCLKDDTYNQFSFKKDTIFLSDIW